MSKFNTQKNSPNSAWSDSQTLLIFRLYVRTKTLKDFQKAWRIIVQEHFKNDTNVWLLGSKIKRTNITHMYDQL